MEIIKSLTKSYHKAIELGDTQKKSEIQLKIAQYYYNKNNFQISKSHLTQILNSNKEFPNVNYYLGLIELNLGNDEIAIQHFKKELKINPHHDFAKDILKKFEIKSNFPSTTILILIISIFTFIISNSNYSTLLKFGASSFNLSIFSLFTSIFFHANLIHLILNSIFLLMFGLYLEKYVGNLKFLSIFIIGGIIGNFAQVLFSPESFVIGMSSGIFAIFAAIVTKEPLLDFKLFGLIKIPLILLFGFVFISQYIIGIIIQLDNILFGEIAHIFGFLTGLLIMVLYNQDLIFIFYNWLIIAIGFILSAISLNKIIEHIINTILKTTIKLNIINLSLNIGLFTFSFLLITYSYYKLKSEILLDEDLGENIQK